MTDLMSAAAVRAHLVTVQAEPRDNTPVIDGIPWRPFCFNRHCPCLIPRGVVACSEFVDVDEDPRDPPIRRCGYCGWTEMRHPGPQRIQRKRTKGWRMPPGAVYVGRPGPWGNPFRVGGQYRTPAFRGRPGPEPIHPNHERALGDHIERVQDFPPVPYVVEQVRDRRHAVDLYRADLRGTRNSWVDYIRAELAGRDLVCWCPLEDRDGRHVPCHGDVLLQVANGAEP